MRAGADNDEIAYSRGPVESYWADSVYADVLVTVDKAQPNHYAPKGNGCSSRQLVDCRSRKLNRTGECHEEANLSWRRVDCRYASNSDFAEVVLDKRTNIICRQG
jgi:hypothetical protein